MILSILWFFYFVHEISNTVDDEDSGLGDDEVSMEELKRSEFKEGMDDDGDGVVLKREMLAYMNPKHPYRHRREAERLVTIYLNDKRNA